MAPTAEIPDRALFKTAEVCAIAQVKPYVLRSWEGEFAALSAAARGSARVYRRVDLELVLEVKRLLYEEGLTLGAARRKLEGEPRSEPEDREVPAGEWLGRHARERIVEVKQGLRSILDLLGADSAPGREERGDAAADRAPQREPARPASRKSRAARASR